jgi:hypothetical protein
MAETMNSMSEADERRELEAMVPPLTRPKTHNVVHGGRFTIAYLILVLVFGGVASLFTYLIVLGDATPSWSTFQPEGEGLARGAKIANHVAPNYRAEGEQLALVEAQPPIVQNRVVDAIAIARERIRPVGGGYRSFEPATRTLFYVFCSPQQQDCTLPNVSEEQVTLLQRESLELALYTFKYMDDIDAVVALLPPTGGQNAAVYLRRRALQKQLEQPLHMTLPGRAPFTVSTLTDKSAVEELTLHRTFPAYFQPAANGGVMLRLGGPPPEESSTQGGGAQTP